MNGMNPSIETLSDSALTELSRIEQPHMFPIMMANDPRAEPRED